MKELKTCPFCRGEEIQYSEDFGGMCCLGCAAYIGTLGTEDEAIEAWNTRADGWIPVSERLPEDDKAYFVTVRVVSDNTTYRCLANYDVRVSAWLQDGKVVVYGVVAWRPLPEPYEGKP